MIVFFRLLKLPQIGGLNVKKSETYLLPARHANQKRRGGQP